MKGNTSTAYVSDLVCRLRYDYTVFMDISGTVTVVTGASRGIGKAIFDELSRRGSRVIGCSKSGNDLLAEVDVSSYESLSLFLKSVEEEHGGIDILINNAGVIHDKKPLEELSLHEYKRCMEINLDGVFYGMSAVLPVMKGRNSGVIINIASRGGTRSHPGLSAYCAGKFAVLGLTQAVAKELIDEKSNVRCISVSPGGVDTDMRAEIFGKHDASLQQSPTFIAECVADIIEEKIPVSNGSDVQVLRGETVEIIPMK